MFDKTTDRTDADPIGTTTRVPPNDACCGATDEEVGEDENAPIGTATRVP